MENNTAQQPQPSPPNINLNPWEIDLSKLKTKEEIKIAQEKLNTWLDELQKEISTKLENNGIKSYQLSFRHIGTQKPIFLYKGNEYEVAKLAKAAYMQITKVILKAISIEE